MLEIHPDVLDAWYNAAEGMVEHNPDATLWDLFRYQMLWEHKEDIETFFEWVGGITGFASPAIQEEIFICPSCDEETEHYARGLCYKCWKKQYRKKKGNICIVCGKSITPTAIKCNSCAKKRKL